ncbi:uncharacterized protein FPRO_02212 [Fusarium proliferatum ET1]|uniref:Uncharacterized protein n=1 Tax=Fusarium proliferatum (strain ET1) TaxID=1227346 RepID=A0A1L7V9T7_FUSPR|nr:uncharacterized protein FPRO_02212 [Fusarium proliferatum ET1]CZR37527.1 uncharacterized protein FPRO_02212 [Fusarium proliferatum ET1]
MMRLTTISCSLSFLLPVYARVISDPCATTTTLPVITVTKGPNGYYNQYIRTYQEFYLQGLTTKVYTITQSCSGVNCQPLPIETAPPPGFTSALVKCDKCGGSGTKVATLTFPTESVQAYSSSGYVVVPIAQPTQIPLRQSEQSHSSSVSENGSSGSDAGHALNNHGASLSTNTSPNSGDSAGQDSGSGSQESQDTSNIGSMQPQSNNGDSNGESSDEADSVIPGSRPLSETPTAVYHFSPSNSAPAGSNGQSSSSADTGSSDEAAAGHDTLYPIPNQKTGNPYAGDTSGASSNGSGSSGNNSPSQNDTPSSGNPATKDSGDDSWSPDSPITVNGAGHIKTNVLTCVSANIAGMFVLSLLV